MCGSPHAWAGSAQTCPRSSKFTTSERHTYYGCLAPAGSTFACSGSSENLPFSGEALMEATLHRQALDVTALEVANLPFQGRCASCLLGLCPFMTSYCPLPECPPNFPAGEKRGPGNSTGMECCFQCSHFLSSSFL